MTMTKHETTLLKALDMPWGDLWDVSMADRLRGLFGPESLFDRALDGSRLMRIEEFMDASDMVIRAELPGIDPAKDVDISVEDGIVHITASREERTEDKRPDGYRTEFHYGKLVRSLRLPEGTSEDDVHASYKDGILEVRVPVPQEPAAKAPHKVPVDRA